MKKLIAGRRLLRRSSRIRGEEWRLSFETKARHLPPAELAAGHRILDQVINVVEGYFVDRLLDFEGAGRRISFHCHDRGFDRRTLVFDAGYFLDDDRNILRKIEILPHPVADLIKRVG